MEIRKRITVKNDGFTNRKKSAAERSQIAVKRYTDKMEEKGWKLDYVSNGDCFAEYEAFVHMYK